MPSLAAVLASNAKFSRPFRPVAVVVGGTSGIGQGVVEAIARHTKGDAHIVIIGRSQSSADSVISGLPKHTGSSYEFVQCDVSLMANVREESAKLASRIEKVNYLVMSPGGSALKRVETPEGWDLSLALNYYARAAFMISLAPLLEKAAEAGEDARAMTIHATRPGSVDIKDLDLRKAWSLQGQSSHAREFNNCVVQDLAARHPTVAFMHAAPGAVQTNVARDLSWPLRATAVALQKILGISSTTCGEYMFYALTDPTSTRGAFYKNSKGEDATLQKPPSVTLREAVWKHTVEVTGVGDAS